jgi:hypothetical protein
MTLASQVANWDIATACARLTGTGVRITTNVAALFFNRGGNIEYRIDL